MGVGDVNLVKDVAIEKQIFDSNYISRDLSWIQFNYRVLDQVKHEDRSILERNFP